MKAARSAATVGITQRLVQPIRATKCRISRFAPPNSRLLKTLVQILKKAPGLRGWQLSALRKRSTEAYWVGSEAETVRCNAVDRYALRLQTPVDQKTMGESTTRFQARPESLAHLVAETEARARLVKNPAFDFCAPYKPNANSNTINDAAIRAFGIDEVLDYGAALQKFRERELKAFPLNSLELFLEEFTYEIKNHRGLEVSSDSTRIVCDYVLTSQDNRHEIMGIKSRRFLKDIAMEEQLLEDARTLSDLQSAELPPTGEFAVVLSGDALDSLFDFFLAQLDAHALFNQYSIFEVGDTVLQNAKEPLTILSTPNLVGGMRSYGFDELGFATKEISVLNDSKVVSFLIDGRYAQILDREQTSALMNIEVACGETPYADFLTDGVIELSKFSTFQPNTISGAFSGEIRLGYLHKNGKKIPIKGGSVSGSTQKAFARAFKSKESVTRSAYKGPKGVLFECLTIAGA